PSDRYHFLFHAKTVHARHRADRVEGVKRTMSIEQTVGKRALTGSLVMTGRIGTKDRLAEMQQIVGDAEIIFCRDKDALAAVVENAEIVGGMVPRDLFPRAQALRWMHSWAAGVDRA